MDTKRSKEKPLSLKELQRVEYEILEVLKDFCDKNHLRYYLCNGTLIGAVRHKGFIPWDDDIDVMMPRPDYEKLKRIVRKDGKLDEYRKLDDLRLNRQALSSVMRVYDLRTKLEFKDFILKKDFGCWIDIFPLDGMSSSSVMRFVQCKLVRVIRDLSIANDTKLGVKRRTKLLTILQYGILPVLPFIRMVGHERWIRLIDRLSRRYRFRDSEYVGVIAGIAGHKEAMLKTRMEPAILVDFEGDKFTAMANYDEYLTNLYGDYMTPPDEKKRVSRHVIEVYWR